MFSRYRILLMVVVTLLLVSSVFAVAVIVSPNTAAAEEATIIVGPSASPINTAEETPIASPSEETLPVPTPAATPTIDSVAVLLDITKYKDRALKVEKRAKKARVKLVELRKCFGKSPPKKLQRRSQFDSWEKRWRYYKNRLESYQDKNRELRTKMMRPGGKGVNRWVPLLRYCGMPESQMWRALKVMKGESHGNPRAKNKSSTASGLYQFLSSWWRNQKTGKIKWDPFDPYQNIRNFVKAILIPGGWGHWALTA